MSSQWVTTTASGTCARIQYQAEDTTATGTTCTMSSRGLWAVAGGVVAAGAGAAIGAIWDRQNVRMMQGPQRRAGYRHSEAIGDWGTSAPEPRSHCGCSYAMRRKHHRDRPESIRIAHESVNDSYERGRKAGLESEKLKKKAIDTSLRLLKSWLSELEYHYLMEQGQLELPSQYEKDVIYIVRKDPTSRVRIQRRPKISCMHQMALQRDGEACINIDGQYPVGDSLLAKIALLKSDEKSFLDIANISWSIHESHYRESYDRRISIAAFAGLLIREVPNTNFWFVQFDINNAERPDAVNHCHETGRDLQFPDAALTVSSEWSNNVYNDIRLPSVGQYFINAPNMDKAVEIARRWRRLDAIELDRHIEEAARNVEQEYAGGITVTMNGSENQNVLLRYGTDTLEWHVDTNTTNAEPTYTTTRLGDRGGGAYRL